MNYKNRKSFESNKSSNIQYPPPKIVHSLQCPFRNSKLPNVSQDCKKYECYLSPRTSTIPFDKSYLDLNCGLAFHDAINHLDLSPELITLTLNALSEAIIECLNSNKFKITNNTNRGKWKISGRLDNFRFENGTWLMHASDCHLSNGYLTLLSYKLKIKLISID